MTPYINSFFQPHPSLPVIIASFRCLAPRPSNSRWITSSLRVAGCNPSAAEVTGSGYEITLSLNMSGAKHLIHILVVAIIGSGKLYACGGGNESCTIIMRAIFGNRKVSRYTVLTYTNQHICAYVPAMSYKSVLQYCTVVMCTGKWTPPPPISSTSTEASVIRYCMAYAPQLNSVIP